MAQIARQDRRAFEVLYDRYAAQAFGVALRMMQDRAAAEDVLQEAFCKVWQRAGQFDTDHKSANVRAWLLTIVHRLAIDAQRNHKPHVEIDAHDDADWDIEDLDADVCEHAFARMSGAQVRAAIARLSDKHRKVIELSYFWGKTHREIAEQLGQPLGTVHSWVKQGMTELKTLLAQQANEVNTGASASAKTSAT
jgi:RNA polymerase sigma-70 factor (ECF subfamily)